MAKRMSEGVTARPVSESRSERSEIIFPSDANAIGNLFGGRLMQFIDLAGAMAASRHARAYTVTASMDHLDFVAPENEMWLHHISSKMRALAYSTIEQFLATTTVGGPQTTGGSSGAFGSPGVTVGGAPIVGVGLTDKKTSIKIYKKQTHYNEWEFVFDPNQSAMDAMAGATTATNGAGTTMNGSGSSGTGFGGSSTGPTSGSSTGFGSSSGSGFGSSSGSGFGSNSSSGFGSSSGSGFGSSSGSGFGSSSGSGFGSSSGSGFGSSSGSGFGSSSSGFGSSSGSNNSSAPASNTPQ